MDDIAFEPLLIEAEVKRWEHMKSVVKFLDHRHTLKPSAEPSSPKPYILLFMGAVPKGDTTTLKNGDRPFDFFDNRPDLLPLCGMTTTTSIIYASAGIPTYQYKVDYDDKPAWYTTMQGNTKWNNKGTFPGAYISGVGFVSDSDVIIPMLQSEQTLAPYYKTIDLMPDLPEGVLNANPFFSLIPHMKGGTPGVIEKMNSEFFSPINEVRDESCTNPYSIVCSSQSSPLLRPTTPSTPFLVAPEKEGDKVLGLRPTHMVRRKARLLHSDGKHDWTVL